MNKILTYSFTQQIFIKWLLCYKRRAKQDYGSESNTLAALLKLKVW